MLFQLLQRLIMRHVRLVGGDFNYLFYLVKNLTPALFRAGVFVYASALAGYLMGLIYFSGFLSLLYHFMNSPMPLCRLQWGL